MWCNFSTTHFSSRLTLCWARGCLPIIALHCIEARSDLWCSWSFKSQHIQCSPLSSWRSLFVSALQAMHSCSELPWASWLHQVCQMLTSTVHGTGQYWVTLHLTWLSHGYMSLLYSWWGVTLFTFGLTVNVGLCIATMLCFFLVLFPRLVCSSSTCAYAFMPGTHCGTEKVISLYPLMWWAVQTAGGFN